MPQSEHGKFKLGHYPAVHKFSALLEFLLRFRDRLIGRTSAFGAEYPGSSPGPGTNSIAFHPLPVFQLPIASSWN